MYPFVPAKAALLLALTACFSTAASTTANATILLPTDTVVTDGQSSALAGTTAALAGVNVNEGALAGDFVIRERRNPAQDDRRISSYLNFDVSGLTLTEVTAPGFSATLELDYVGQLNDVNSAAAQVGAVTTAAWDSATNLPLHSYGFDADAGSVSAAFATDILADIAAVAPTGQVVTADITSIVQGWVDGTLDNFGLVLFSPILESQGAGFNSPQIVTVVPEPASAALLGLGAAMILVRRRNA